MRRRRERRRSSQKEEGKGSRKASQETSGLVGVVFNCHNCGDNDGRDGDPQRTVFFNGDFSACVHPIGLGGKIRVMVLFAQRWWR